MAAGWAALVLPVVNQGRKAIAAETAADGALGTVPHQGALWLQVFDPQTDVMLCMPSGKQAHPFL